MKKFNIYLKSESQVFKDMIDELKIELNLKRKEHYVALRIVILNLYLYESILISRGKKSYSKSRYNPERVGCKSIIKVLDELVDKNYIDQEKGFIEFRSEGKSVSKLTSITITDSLKDLMAEHDWYEKDSWLYIKTNNLTIDSSNVETIVLRKEKNKTLTDYEDSEWTVRARHQLAQYNDLLFDTDIDVEDFDQEIYMSFNGEIVKRYFIQSDVGGSDGFKQGGRLSAGWCGLKKSTRKRIKIDGDSVIELDFQASSLNAIYIHETGKSYQQGDPYEVMIDGELIPRVITKKISNMILFCFLRSGLVSALKKYFTKEEGKDYLDVYKRCENIYGISRIIEAFIEKHAMISDYFLKGKSVGLYIQFLESERVMNVVQELTNRDIPVLTVYDSFIVNCYYENDLREVMSKYS